VPLPKQGTPQVLYQVQHMYNIGTTTAKQRLRHTKSRGTNHLCVTNVPFLQLSRAEPENKHLNCGVVHEEHEHGT
jgi:hypothetical protein